MIERTWHLRTRTVRALYLIVGSFTLLLLGLGIFVVISMALLPETTGSLPVR